MDKLDWLYGFLLGVGAATLGSYIFVSAFTDFDFMEGVVVLRYEGILGKLLTLGALLNIGVFFLLLHFKKETMAKGVILSTFFLATLTFFV